MSTSNFFSTENRHNERLIRVLSVGSLVSKPPTKEKRISIKVRMPLSTGGIGTGIMGAPEFIEAGYLFVAKHGDTVTPDMEFKGYALEFSAENLFGEPILAGDSIMRGFEIAEFGNEEAPDVVCNFTIRIPFSGNRWQWLGMFVGEDVWVKFTPGEAGTVRVETEQDGTLLDDGENEDDDAEGEEEDTDVSEDSETETEDEAVGDESPDPRISLVAGGKSGPKSLAAFHEQEVGKAEKPRRPRGFSKPLHSGNEEF